ncbi:MAG: 23S rRNA (guanosine(2251)-2'-O)-methyltransferase RlmB [Acidimicrobiales bacterium]
MDRFSLGGDQVEGRQAVRELLVAGRRKVKEVLFAGELDPSPIVEDIRELCELRRVPLHEVSRAKFDSLARTGAPQGVLALALPLPDAELEALCRPSAGGPPLLVALDGVTDPGNLGALLRSAECAGATGVILPAHRNVHVTPAVTKAAAGAAEYLPMTVVGGLATALTRMKELGVWVVGLAADADADLYELSFADAPLAVVLGAEGKGLSRLVRERCDALVRIPQAGQLNSLNVAAAGAVACFEIARRRAGR